MPPDPETAFVWYVFKRHIEVRTKRRSTTDTAKVFRSGRSQAVRLPEQYRLGVDEVRVRRQGAALVLEPVANDWDWLEDVMGDLDPEFAAAALEPVALR